MGRFYPTHFAQAYGEDAYSECIYNDTTACTTTGGGTSNNGTGSGGGLSDTGLLIALIVAIACLIMFIALIVRFWRRPARQEVPTGDFGPKPPVSGGQPPIGPSID